MKMLLPAVFESIREPVKVNKKQVPASFKFHQRRDALQLLSFRIERRCGE